MATLVFILFMFLITMFIVYFDYILSTVSLSSCLYISSYNTYSKVHGVGGGDTWGMVLICDLSDNTLYISCHVVDRGCDRPVESFVVHFPNIGHRSRA
jgi:hypothetical protein